MFVKDFFLKSAKALEPDKSFYQLYNGYADAYCLVKGKKEELVKNAKLTFIEEKEPVKYLLIIGGSSKASLYKFPVRTDVLPQFVLDQKNQLITFEFQLPDEVTLLLEFDVSKPNGYEMAGEFREVLARLIYQSLHRKSWQSCKNLEELDKLVKESNPKPKTAYDQVEKHMETVIKNYSSVFCGIGAFGRMEKPDASSTPVVLIKESIFSIVTRKKFAYEFVVFDENGKEAYATSLNESTHYFCDEAHKNICWLDVKQANLICYTFTFAMSVISQLKLCISACIIESRQQKPLSEILANEEDQWNQYYFNPKRDFLEEEDIQEYNKYQANHYEPNLSEFIVEPQHIPPQKTEVRTFVQSKKDSRAFASQGNGLGIYKIGDNQNGLDYLANVPIVSTYQSQSLVPKKMHLQEGDGKLVFLDAHNKNKMYYYDLGKEKLVSEFEEKDLGEIKDISHIGAKDPSLTASPLFLSIGERDIFRMDPRLKGGIAEAKNYKTNPKFENILGVKDDGYAVGSKTGEIRFYKNVGSNASNLIPSYNGSSVVSLDSSKDGQFLLVNCGTSLLLFPTFQGNLSAYKTIFRKDSKPTPKILKIHPAVLSQYGIKEPKFITAKFDEKKDGREQFIIATSEHFIAIWNLSRVLQGYLDTKNVKKVNEQLVGGEFIYDKDGIIAALKDKLVFQPNAKA